MALRTLVALLLSAGFATAAEAGPRETYLPAPAAKHVTLESSYRTYCTPDCLPANYSGPIFVSDIDDTLRPVDVAGVVFQQSIPGVKELLASIGARHVPILYLTAGFILLIPINVVFLNDLPKGTLVNSLAFDPFRTKEEQAAYKSAVLQKLKGKYTSASLYCLGDNKYGDAVAYTGICAGVYIRDVSATPWYPTPFSGYVFKNYDSATYSRITGDIMTAMPQSPVTPVTLWPEVPSEVQLFLGGVGQSSGTPPPPSPLLPCLLLSLAAYLLAA